MNREILFKGKRVSNGEWVEGYIVKRPTGEWQIERRCDNPPDGDPMWKKVLITYEVKPDTICQYTGLTDKNGNKIWENDIVKASDGDIGIIKYGIDGRASFHVYYEKKKDYILLGENNVEMLKIKVIGNIFDNPEFLEGGAEKEGGTDV